MQESAGHDRHCPVCMEQPSEWLRFLPCLHFAWYHPVTSLKCALGWLELKHECPVCKTAVTQVDRYCEAKKRTEENTPMPFLKPSNKEDSIRVGQAHQDASEALDKPFFMEEFTKLLGAISDKHSMYLTVQQFGDAYGRQPPYSYAGLTKNRA
jgi:hypothetical protein